MTSLLIHNSSSAVIDFFFLQWGWSQMGLKLPTFIFLPSSTCLSLCAVKIISVVNNWLSVFSNLLVIPEENHFIKPKIMLHLRGQWWCDQFHPWLLAKLEDVWPLVHQWIIINWWPSILWKLCCFYIREIFLFFFFCLLLLLREKCLWTLSYGHISKRLGKIKPTAVYIIQDNVPKWSSCLELCIWWAKSFLKLSGPKCVVTFTPYELLPTARPLKLHGHAATLQLNLTIAYERMTHYGLNIPVPITSHNFCHFSALWFVTAELKPRGEDVCVLFLTTVSVH